MIIKLTTLFSLALSLFGCHIGDTTWSHRIIGDHDDALYSKARAKDGQVRFACIESSSGRCWYTVVPGDCHDEACMAKPLARFSLLRGDEREFTGLPEFRFCVARDAAPPTPDCRERG